MITVPFTPLEPFKGSWSILCCVHFHMFRVLQYISSYDGCMLVGFEEWIGDCNMKANTNIDKLGLMKNVLNIFLKMYKE